MRRVWTLETARPPCLLRCAVVLLPVDRIELLIKEQRETAIWSFIHMLSAQVSPGWIVKKWRHEMFHVHSDHCFVPLLHSPWVKWSWAGLNIMQIAWSGIQKGYVFWLFWDSKPQLASYWIHRIWSQYHWCNFLPLLPLQFVICRFYRNF